MKTGERTVGGHNVQVMEAGELTVGVATDIGPRVLFLAHASAPDKNLFGLPDLGIDTPDGRWQIRGGHRLWTAPESMPRSYPMDDKPVRVAAGKDGLTIEGNPEVNNGISKTVSLRPRDGGIEVVHTVRNIGRWPVRAACWALSVMRTGGFAVVPLKPEKVDPHGLLPDRRITLWPYTDAADARLKAARDCFFIFQNPAVNASLKFGAMAKPSWIAYCTDGFVFAKSFRTEPKEYPDFGCSVEVYTNKDFLELETLGPLENVEPGAAISHTEFWQVFPADVSADPASVRKNLEPHLAVA